MRRVLLAIAFLSFAVIGECALNKTSPLSATTNLRCEAYVDSFSTIAKSTWTINLTTWTWINYDLTYVENKPEITVSVVDKYDSSLIIQKILSLDEFMNIIISNTKDQMINEVVDDDVEQYLVFPGTSAPIGWRGFCSSYTSSGKIIPVNCPK